MAAPQTGLTSCQIGDMGHPRTVHGNPRHTPRGEVNTMQGKLSLPEDQVNSYYSKQAGELN